jgi:hypothetical protein
VGVSTGDVDASSRNSNTNLNRTGDQNTFVGGDRNFTSNDTRVSTGDVSNRLSNDSRSGVTASGNSLNLVDGAESRSRATNGDVTGSNTLIIGGQGGEFGQEGEGFGSTLSPTATTGDSTATVGDQTQTNEITGNNSSVGDINVTVEGLSEDAARSLGQPDVVEVDSRDLSTENQNIDASTEINDNSSVTYEAAEIPVNSAAVTFASICTSGASGQGRAFGASISVTSDQCAHLMQADVFMALYQSETDEDLRGEFRDKAIWHAKAAARHVKHKGLWGHVRHVITVGIL